MLDADEERIDDLEQQNEALQDRIEELEFENHKLGSTPGQQDYPGVDPDAAQGKGGAGMIDQKALCHAKTAIHYAQKIARGLNWKLKYRHGYNLRLNDPVQRLFDAEDEIANAIDRLRLARYRLLGAIEQELKNEQGNSDN